MIIDFRGEWVGRRKFRVGVVCGISSYYIPYNGIIPQITTYNTKMNRNAEGLQIISRKIYISISIKMSYLFIWFISCSHTKADVKCDIFT